MRVKLCLPLGRIFLLFLISGFISNSSSAQSIQVVCQGKGGQDSSFYDIFQFSDNKYWIGGEYGILKQLNNEGNLTSVVYPNLGVSILKIAQQGEESILMAGDKGTLYRKKDKLSAWEIIQPAGYKNKCFYDLTIVNDSIALMCGGKSKIAYGKKSIPGGFILKTEDRGVTWKKVFGRTVRMFWRIKPMKIKGEFYLLSYAPWGSRIFKSSDNGDSWKKTEFKSNNLWYDLKVNPSGNLICHGGKNGQIYQKGSGCIDNLSDSKSRNQLLKQQPLNWVWDYGFTDDWEVMTSMRGQMNIKNQADENWQLISLPTGGNLYKICPNTPNSFWVIGSQQGVYRVSLPDGETSKKTSSKSEQ